MRLYGLGCRHYSVCLCCFFRYQTPPSPLRCLVALIFWSFLLRVGSVFFDSVCSSSLVSPVLLLILCYHYLFQFLDKQKVSRSFAFFFSVHHRTFFFSVLSLLYFSFSFFSDYRGHVCAHPLFSVLIVSLACDRIRDPFCLFGSIVLQRSPSLFFSFRFPCFVLVFSSLR